VTDQTGAEGREIVHDYLIWLVFVGLAWVLQLFLSIGQMRRFYRRVADLKRLGRTAVGVGGGTYRGRAYAVVVVDPTGRVVTAELMTGISVFAHLKPLTEVRGWNLQALCQTPPAALKKKQQAALCAAAKKIRQGGETSGSLRDLPSGVEPNNS
jgi:DNA-binding transcriptional regulator of glucitol operon